MCHAIPELAIEGKLKAGFVYHNNPLRTNPNPARVIEGYRKLELLVSFDYVLSETASVAHYILPESYYLERDDVVHNNHCYKSKQVAIRQAVIKPLYDTKPMVQILMELAPHLGIGQYFNFTLDDWNRAAWHHLGVTLEELKKEGVIDLGGEWKPGEPKFDTPSGKLEFVSSTIAGPEPPGRAGLGGAAGDARPEGSPLLPADSRQAGASHPRSDGQSTLSHAYHHGERLGKRVDSQRQSQSPGHKGWGLHDAQLVGGQGQGQGKGHGRDSSGMRLPAQRLWGFFEESAHRLRVRDFVQ